MVATMKRYAIFPVLVALFFAFPPRGVRGEEKPAGSAVQINADELSYNQKSGSYQATGNVVIRWRGSVLDAEKATLNEAKSEAVAEGKVSLKKNGDLLRSDRLKVNYVTENGEVENGDLFVAGSNFHLRGRRLAKEGAAKYHLESGSFTTCDGPAPSWQFTATDLDVTLEEFALGRNAVFYVGPVPLFYTPYILFPVKRERQSGFLFPRVGTSEKKGFNFDLPYYWAISPSQDVTFDLDVQTKRGVGVGGDYRYLRLNGSHGSMRSYYIYDTVREMNRGDLAVRQWEGITPTLTVMSDLRLALDRDFYRDFGEATGDYNRQILDSSLSATKRWEAASLGAEVRYLENLDAPNNRETLQRLPTLTGNIVGKRLGAMPLYATLDTEFTHFQRDVGSTGERLDLHPSLGLYWRDSFPVQFALWGGYRQRLYNAYGASAQNGYHGDGIADAGAAASMELERVYDVSRGELRRLKHTLVPELRYTYVQEKSQESLPFFDFNDRVVGGSFVGWSLASYLTGKFQRDDAAPGYRDLLFIRVSQGYQLAGSRRDLLTLVDEGRNLTDVRLEARLTPLPRVSFSTDSRYNTQQTRFSTASVAGDVADASGNSVGLGYQYAREEVNYLEGRLGLTLVKPFIFHYTGRYSVDGGAFLESYYALEFKRQCWSVIVTYRDRLNNREVLVSFNLAGIGSLGQIKAF